MTEPEPPGIPPHIELDPHPEPPATGAPSSASAPWDPPIQDPLRPIPWEDAEAELSWWNRLVATVKLCFSAPLEAADRIPVTEGFWRPYCYLLLCSTPVLVFTALGQMLSVAIQGAIFGSLGASRPNPFQELGLGTMGAGVIALIVILFLLVVMPLFLFLGMFIGGALTHLFLWMFGGTKEGVGLGQTIRCYAYANGAYQIVSAIGSIPVIGCFFLFLLIPFAIVWLVYYGLALARMHRTDSWRGVCAVFAPIFLVCCCAGIAIATAIGFAARHAH